MKKGWIMLLIATSFISGCGLREQEVEVKNEITIVSYDAANTASDYVRRGDLDGREYVTLNLKASQENEYYFSVSGKLIEKVYVNVGEMVTAGQLLAETENEDIRKRAKESRIEVASIQEGIDYNTRMLELEKQKKEYNKDKKQTNLDAISRYILEIEKLSSQLSIAQKEANEWENELLKTQIYANEDGVVSCVGVYGNGAVSDEKMPFFKVRKEENVFGGTIKGEHELEVGQQIAITIAGIEYSATIQSVNKMENAMDITVTPNEYIDMTDITLAEYVWSREPLNDVLYVPTDAIVTVKGEYYVYVYDEKGFPDPVKVTIGKIGPKYTNIESGVKEGDLVELF